MISRSPHPLRGPLLALLAVFLFVLSGCGRLFGQEEASAPPAPPLGPARFADVDLRSYLPDRLLISAINVDTPVVELGWSATQDDAGRIFSEWDVADNAAGWHKNSAQLGEGGNVVMSGHNNILGAVFRELDQLKAGDPVVVWSSGRRFDYRIDKVMIVPDKHASLDQRRNNAQWIGAFDDDRLTLVSCWPRDDNTHRIIVVAYRLEGKTVQQAAHQSSARP